MFPCSSEQLTLFSLSSLTSLWIIWSWDWKCQPLLFLLSLDQISMLHFSSLLCSSMQKLQILSLLIAAWNKGLPFLPFAWRMKLNCLLIPWLLIFLFQQRLSFLCSRVMGNDLLYCWEMHYRNEICITFLLIWLSSSPKQFSKLTLNLFLFLPSFFWARKELYPLNCSRDFLPNSLFPEWSAHKMREKDENPLEKILSPLDNEKWLRGQQSALGATANYF